MAGKVVNIKVCSPLKLNHGLTGKHHAICHYSYNLPLVCHEAVVFQQVQILPKQFAVHLEELQTDKPVRVTLKLCILE